MSAVREWAASQNGKLLEVNHQHLISDIVVSKSFLIVSLLFES
jgi:hypothetical protein